MELNTNEEKKIKTALFIMCAKKSKWNWKQKKIVDLLRRYTQILEIAI